MENLTRKGVPSSGDSENLDVERACVFCKIIRGEISSEKILEGEEFLAIKDINPKVKNHCLIIPKRHYEGFLDMPSEIYGKFLIFAKETLVKLGVKNFNLVMNNGKIAGQLVSHAHLHILPRVAGDGFSLNV